MLAVVEILQLIPSFNVNFQTVFYLFIADLRFINCIMFITGTVFYEYIGF